ncbi:MAG: hypothetical protein KJ566_00870 [Nanoarchaeota archaeon]|nr:hypothetical protein [Nanoarchaeota archaeon]
MSEISPIDVDENVRTMNYYIFDEDRVLKNKIFTQLKLNENTFAYGLLLPKEKELTDKKGDVIGHEQVWAPVLITSDGKLIEATKEVEMVYNIKFNAIPTKLILRWSLESIKNYLEADDKVPELTPRELFEKIKSSSEKISSFREKRWYKVNSVRDGATYVFSLFETFPIKEERGLTGTGKTKEMKRSKNISFNATGILINPSESTLFRETHDKRPTKYIDEAEKLFQFKKGGMESDSRVELINGSYSKGSSIPRVEKIKEKFVVVYYDVYSPTTIGSINGLYGATEGRAITQIHTRSLDNDSRGEIEVYDNDPEWRMIRDNLYLFGLKYWKQIEEIYNDTSIWKNLKLKKRDLQVWKPILTIAKLIGDDWFNEILGFACELSEMKLDDLISESSFDFMCLKALKETIQIYNETDKHYLEKIKDVFCRDKPEDSKNNIYLNRNIGQHFKKLGFTKKRDGIGTYIIADKRIFDEIVSPISPQLAFTSTLSTLSTQTSVNDVESCVDVVKMNVDKKKEVCR